MILAGAARGDEAGLLGLLGLAALAQGIGLGVAALSFAMLEHNPLSSGRADDTRPRRDDR